MIDQFCNDDETKDRCASERLDLVILFDNSEKTAANANSAANANAFLILDILVPRNRVPSRGLIIGHTHSQPRQAHRLSGSRFRV
ncbi:unnamed protein product, partial [Mesorhabditis belari]|uniref:Uncharacterized protein n=1 Tax=Mesorhabditis belari TaxID=2138241 RepID=A0AAF3F0V0_9BILA